MAPDQPKVSLTYSLGTFQTVIFFFSLGLRVSKTAHEPAKRGISDSYNTLGPPQTSAPLVFQARCPIQIPGVGVLNVEHQPFTLLGEALGW